MGKEADPNRAEERGGAEKAQESVHTPRPIRPQPASPPFGGQVGLPRATSPSNSRKTLQPTHGQTHRISLPHLTVNPSPPFPPTSHSQIDGRRQAAHSPREESVMAGSMQVPSMAMCGIDGFERPLHPSQSERALASDLNIQIRSKCTCSLGASKAVVQNRINCTHLGRHFPVRGVRGTSRRVQPPRKPGKPFQCDAPGAASSSVRSLRNRKTIPESDATITRHRVIGWDTQSRKHPRERHKRATVTDPTKQPRSRSCP